MLGNKNFSFIVKDREPASPVTQFFFALYLVISYLFLSPSIFSWLLFYLRAKGIDVGCWATLLLLMLVLFLTCLIFLVIRRDRWRIRILIGLLVIKGIMNASSVFL